MTSSMTHVAIIGAGEIGQALSHVLSKNTEVSINLWDKQEDRVPDQKPLAEVVASANCVFLCVPSWVLRSVAREIAEHLSPTAVVISLAKGIEEKTLKTMDQILAEELPVTLHGVIGGPLIAEELLADLSGIGVLAASDDRLFVRMMPIFLNTNLHIEHNSDIHGVALCGVIKNIYAMGLAMAADLKFGSNFNGWLIKQACYEMGDILTVLGGQRDTAYSSAGLADLVATGSSVYSKNYVSGEEIAEKGATEQKSEGIVSLPQLLELVGTNANTLPLLGALREIIQEKKNAKEALTSLLHNAQW